MKTRKRYFIALIGCLLLMFPVAGFAQDYQTDQTEQGLEESPEIEQPQELNTEMQEQTGAEMPAEEGMQAEGEQEQEVAEEAPSQRVDRAIATLKDMMDREGDKIPPEVVQNAEAIAIFPDLTKAGIIVGGRYGTGVMMVNQDGNWNGPLFLSIYGASVGAQLGVESTDMVMAFMDQESLRDLQDGTLEFGAEASVTAGYYGEKAKASTAADILGYQDTSGLFAGVSLSSGYIEVNQTANEDFFQQEQEGETRAYYPTTEDILTGKETPQTDLGSQLSDVLSQYAQQADQQGQMEQPMEETEGEGMTEVE